MWIKRLSAWVMSCSAILMIGPEVKHTLDAGFYAPVTLMRFWQHYSPGSLDIVQKIQNSPLFFWVWDPVVTTALDIPAWGVPLIIALYLFNSCHEPAPKPILQ